MDTPIVEVPYREKQGESVSILLEGIQVNKREMHSLCHRIVHNPNITGIRLINCRINTETCRMLCQALPNFPIQRLIIQFIETSQPSDNLELMQAISSMRNLKYLTISGGLFSGPCTEPLAKLLRQNRNLIVLSLSYIDLLECKNFDDVADCFHDPQCSVESLGLGLNILQRYAKTRIIDSLLRKRIKNVYFFCCGLNQDDIGLLCQVLPNSRVTHLSISNNQLTQTSCDMLSTVFKRNPDLPLKSLNISNCSLTDPMTRNLFEGIQTLTNIHSVFLKGNTKLSTCHDVILKSIKTHNRLSDFNLLETKFPDEIVQLIQAASNTKKSDFYRICILLLATKLPCTTWNSRFSLFPVEVIRQIAISIASFTF